MFHLTASGLAGYFAPALGGFVWLFPVGGEPAAFDVPDGLPAAAVPVEPAFGGATALLPAGAGV